MKKGFTLAELLGVIIILALVSLIAIPAVTDSLNTQKKNLCEVQISNIIATAKEWGVDHMLQLPDEGGKLEVKVSELIRQGYLTGDKNAKTEDDRYKVINPNTKEYFSPDPTITITKVGKKYVYTMDDVTVKSCQS